MGNLIKIKKGLDIPMNGAVTDQKLHKDSTTDLFAIVPDDFPGYTWKCNVKAGDTVKAGEALLYAKEDEKIALTTPVAGVVAEINRGERRKIEYVSVKKSGESQKEFAIGNDADSALEVLKESGLFAMMRQRPFDIVPFSDKKPRDIFVTGIDSAPLAAELMTANVKEYLDKGLEVLSCLCTGNVYLSLKSKDSFETTHAKIYKFEGPHPIGNPGTQIAAINPVNKGETVWTLDVVTASRIGKLFAIGKVDYSTVVAITGAEVKSPKLIETTIGASLGTLLKGELKNVAHTRVISGNVLTGVQVNPENGFLRYPYRQITAIPEGDEADEFMGWASMDPKKYSVKKTFPAFLRGLSKPFGFDARIKGGHRAFIMSGEFDKVFPMDIYPEFLLKAIMAKDIEKMEQLGIYEVAPEDFALAEFVDTSKMELQKIVRQGLDYLKKETI